MRGTVNLRHVLASYSLLLSAGLSVRGDVRLRPNELLAEAIGVDEEPLESIVDAVSVIVEAGGVIVEAVHEVLLGALEAPPT